MAVAALVVGQQLATGGEGVEVEEMKPPHGRAAEEDAVRYAMTTPAPASASISLSE